MKSARGAHDRLGKGLAMWSPSNDSILSTKKPSLIISSKARTRILVISRPESIVSPLLSCLPPFFLFSFFLNICALHFHFLLPAASLSLLLSILQVSIDCLNRTLPVFSPLSCHFCTHRMHLFSTDIALICP